MSKNNKIKTTDPLYQKILKLREWHKYYIKRYKFVEKYSNIFTTDFNYFVEIEQCLYKQRKKHPILNILLNKDPALFIQFTIKELEKPFKDLTTEIYAIDTIWEPLLDKASARRAKSLAERNFFVLKDKIY